MKLDDLKNEWQSEVKTNTQDIDITKLVKSIEEETLKLDKTIARRDRIEITIALLLIPVWSVKLFYSAGFIQSLGLIIAIAACIYIPYKLIKAKQVETPKDGSLLDFLLLEKIKVTNQKRLVESVLSWYLAPLAIAITLITAGGTVNDAGIPQLSTQLIVYYGFCTLLYVGIYFLNKRAAKKQFAPMLKKIEERIVKLKNIDA